MLLPFNQIRKIEKNLNCLFFANKTNLTIWDNMLYASLSSPYLIFLNQNTGLFHYLFESVVILNDLNGIKSRFSRSARTYNAHAVIQRRVAQTLVSDVCVPPPQSILEIGCGTGLFTSQLLKKFPQASMTVSDMSSDMLGMTKAKLKNQRPIHYKLLNPEFDPIDEKFDLIGASMVIHWFQDVQTALETIRGLLNPGGTFYFSTIGQNCFPEWQLALKSCGLPIGLRLPPPLPGIYKEEQTCVSYPSARAFLKSLKETGANRPRINYTPLAPSQLKAAMTYLDQQESTTVTWHIQYGCIRA